MQKQAARERLLVLGARLGPRGIVQHFLALRVVVAEDFDGAEDAKAIGEFGLV